MSLLLSLIAINLLAKDQYLAVAGCNSGKVSIYSVKHKVLTSVVTGDIGAKAGEIRAIGVSPKRFYALVHNQGKLCAMCYDISGSTLSLVSRVPVESDASSLEVTKSGRVWLGYSRGVIEALGVRPRSDADASMNASQPSDLRLDAMNQLALLRVTSLTGESESAGLHLKSVPPKSRGMAYGHSFSGDDEAWSDAGFFTSGRSIWTLDERALGVARIRKTDKELKFMKIDLGGFEGMVGTSVAPYKMVIGDAGGRVVAGQVSGKKWKLFAGPVRTSGLLDSEARVFPLTSQKAVLIAAANRGVIEWWSYASSEKPKVLITSGEPILAAFFGE